MHLNRRRALMFLGANAWAMRPAWADAPGSAPGRLVLVFLRGAYDGISALVPHGDPRYHQLRPSIAIAKPDGSLSSALALDPPPPPGALSAKHAEEVARWGAATI